MIEPWLTQREVAARLRVSLRTVQRLRLPCTQVGGQKRYFLSEVRAALDGVPTSGGNVVALRPRREETAA